MPLEATNNLIYDKLIAGGSQLNASRGQAIPTTS
jgi:hypothetical protein